MFAYPGESKNGPLKLFKMPCVVRSPESKYIDWAITYVEEKLQSLPYEKLEPKDRTFGFFFLLEKWLERLSDYADWTNCFGSDYNMCTFHHSI